MKVTFNKAVNETAGKAMANYALKDNNGSTVTVGQVALNTEKTEATLTIGATAPAALAANKEHTLTISKDLTQASTPVLATALTKTFTPAADVAVPQVAAAEAIGTKVVRVTFSKPVTLNGTAASIFAIKKSDNTFSKGDDYAGTALAAAYVDGSGYTKVDVTATTGLPVGERAIQVLGSSDGTDYISDAQGLKMTTIEKTFNVSVATTVAQATDVEVKSRTEVRVKFDAAVTAGGNVTWTGESKAGASATGTKVDDVTVKYTFDSANALPVGTVELTVPAVTDAYGNTTQSKKFTKTVAADSAVTITAAQDGTSQKAIKVTYSTDMTTGSGTGGAEVVSSYSVVSSTGAKVTPSSVSYASKVATLTLAKNLEVGTYTITVTGVKNQLGDEAGTLSTTVAIADKTAPGAPTVTGTISGSHDLVLFMDYAENMMFSGANSAINPANIFVKQSNTSGTYYALDSLPTGYTGSVSKVNDKRVRVQISHASTDYVAAGATTNVKVQLIADAAGNVMPSALEVTTATIVASTTTIGQNTTAYCPANSVKVTGAKTITIDVKNVQFDAVKATDFDVYTVTSGQVFSDAAVSGQTPAGKALITVSSASVANKTGYATITLTTGADIPVTTKDVFVATKNADLATKTTTGLKFAQDRVFLNADSGTNAVKAKNAIASAFVRAAIIDDDDIVLEFSNEVPFVDANDFLFNVDGAATNIKATNVYALDGTTGTTSTTSRKVKFHFASTPFAANSSVTVKTVAEDLIGSVDVNGNKIAAFTTPVAVRNVPAVASVTFAKKASDTLAGALSTGDTIAIKFTEEIPDTATVANWIKSVKLVSGTPDALEFYASNNVTGTKVADVVLTKDVVATAGNGKYVVVDATKDSADPTKLVLSKQRDGSLFDCETPLFYNLMD